METVGLVLIVVLVVLIALGLAVRRGVANTEPWIKYLQGVITCTAIILAGYLYFVERRSKPHAEVSQTVEAVSVGDGVVAIQASVLVKNVGTQLLTIDHVIGRLQIIDLRLLGVEELAGLKGKDYWKAKSKTGRDVFLGPEARWRQLRYYDSDDFLGGQVEDQFLHKIEPGESDLTTFSFVIPCPKKARHIRIATDVANPATGITPAERVRARQDRKKPQPEPSGAAPKVDATEDGPEEMFWKARTTVDLEPVCGRKDEPNGQGGAQPTIKT